MTNPYTCVIKYISFPTSLTSLVPLYKQWLCLTWQPWLRNTGVHWGDLISPYILLLPLRVSFVSNLFISCVKTDFVLRVPPTASFLLYHVFLPVSFCQFSSEELVRPSTPCYDFHCKFQSQQSFFSLWTDMLGISSSSETVPNWPLHGVF